MRKILIGLLLVIVLIFISGCESAIDDIIDDAETFNLTVAIEGEGDVIPEEGTHQIESGTTVSLEAISAEGYLFSHWQGDVADPTSELTSILMDGNKTVKACFIATEQSTIAMIRVEAGTTSSENASLTVNDDFYIGKYHVTQAQFEDVMGFNPSYFAGAPDNPVENVTWYDAVMFCNKLSEREGLDKYYNISDIEYYGEAGTSGGHPDNIESATVIENIAANGYRLPSVIEHEYAARGGKNGAATIYAGSDDLNEVGWFWRNSGDEWLDGDWDGSRLNENNCSTNPVGEKLANELGLYDMSGNVMDWTNTLTGSNRYIRGGAWNDDPSFCQVDTDFDTVESRRMNKIGFRLAL